MGEDHIGGNTEVAPATVDTFIAGDSRDFLNTNSEWDADFPCACLEPPSSVRAGSWPLRAARWGELNRECCVRQWSREELQRLQKRQGKRIPLMSMRWALIYTHIQ